MLIYFLKYFFTTSTNLSISLSFIHKCGVIRTVFVPLTLTCTLLSVKYSVKSEGIGSLNLTPR